MINFFFNCKVRRKDASLDWGKEIASEFSEPEVDDEHNNLFFQKWYNIVMILLNLKKNWF